MSEDAREGGHDLAGVVARPIRLQAAILLALAGAACGPSGTEEVPAPGPCDAASPTAPGPGDVEDYFPLNQGATWNYRVVGGTLPSPVIASVTVGESRTVRGFQAVAMNEDPVDYLARTERYVAKDAQGVIDLGTGGAYDPAFVDAPFPMVPGTVARGSCAGANLGEDLDGDGKPETYDLATESKVLGLEDVATRWGTVPSAAHVHTLMVVTLHTTRAPQTPVTVTAVKDAWYAKQIGLVGQDDGTTFHALLGYAVEGVRRGLVDLKAVEADPLPTWRLEPLRGVPMRALLLGTTSTPSGMALDGRIVGAGFEVGPTFGIFSDLEDSGRGYRYRGLAVGSGQVLFVAGRTRGYGFDVIAQRVTDDAVALDGPGGALVATCDSDTGFGPGVVASSDGADFLVAWPCFDAVEGNEIWAARITAGGVLGAPFRVAAVTDGQIQFVQTAFDGINHLVVYGAGDTMTTAVRAVRVGAGGILDVTPISVVANLLYKWPGDLVCGPSGCLLAWLDARRHYPTGMGPACESGERGRQAPGRRRRPFRRQPRCKRLCDRRRLRLRPLLHSPRRRPHHADHRRGSRGARHGRHPPRGAAGRGPLRPASQPLAPRSRARGGLAGIRVVRDASLRALGLVTAAHRRAGSRGLPAPDPSPRNFSLFGGVEPFSSNSDSHQHRFRIALEGPLCPTCRAVGGGSCSLWKG